MTVLYSSWIICFAAIVCSIQRQVFIVFYSVLKDLGWQKEAFLIPIFTDPPGTGFKAGQHCRAWEQLCIPAFPSMWWVGLSCPLGWCHLWKALFKQGSTELGSSTMAGRHHDLSSCWVLTLFFSTWIQCNRHERFVLRIRKETCLTLVRQGPAVREGRKCVQCIIVGKKQREDKVGEMKSEMDR